MVDGGIDHDNRRDSDVCKCCMASSPEETLCVFCSLMRTPLSPDRPTESCGSSTSSQTSSSESLESTLRCRLSASVRLTPPSPSSPPLLWPVAPLFLSLFFFHSSSRASDFNGEGLWPLWLNDDSTYLPLQLCPETGSFWPAPHTTKQSWVHDPIPTFCHCKLLSVKWQ